MRTRPGAAGRAGEAGGSPHQDHTARARTSTGCTAKTGRSSQPASLSRKVWPKNGQ